MAKKGLQKKTRIANKILTVVFSLVSLLYLYPLVMMVLSLGVSFLSDFKKVDLSAREH